MWLFKPAIQKEISEDDLIQYSKKLLIPIGFEDEVQIYQFLGCNVPELTNTQYQKLFLLMVPILDDIARFPYMVTVFVHGMVNYPSLPWILSTYSKLPRPVRKNLQKLMIVSC